MFMKYPRLTYLARIKLLMQLAKKMFSTDTMRVTWELHTLPNGIECGYRRWKKAGLKCVKFEFPPKELK